MNYALKKIALLILLVQSSCTLKGQDFRNYSWGTHKSLIVGEEGKPILNKYDQDFVITYENIPISGINIRHTTHFYFSHLDLLQSAGYNFDDITQAQKKALIKKLILVYGQPHVGDFTGSWPYKVDFFSYKKSWKNKSTRILLGEDILSNNACIKYFSEKLYQNLLKREKVGL